ncbi:MAG: CapA family protein [Treponema sp.]|nr:CapA family protein [Treponema sp.]
MIIQEGSSLAAERIWLEEALGSSPELETLGLRLDSASVSPDKVQRKKIDSEITIEFFSSWIFENSKYPAGAAPGQASPKDLIVVSKTWFVPQEDSLAGRMETTLELCLEGKENLVGIDGIAPPFVALKVDGDTAGDDGYPLIRLGLMRLVFDESNKNCVEKAAALEKLLREFPRPLIKEKPVLTWISSAGDMMLGRNAGNILLNQGPKALFGGAAEIFRQSDLVIVNLEGSLSSRGRPAQKSYTFRFEPPKPLAAAVKNAGIDAVLYANNHTFDYGEEAFLDTMNYLDEAGIAFLGTGRNEEEALSPFIFEKDNFSAHVWGLVSFPGERSGYDGLGNVAGPDKAGFLHARRGGAEKIKARFSKRDRDGKESLNMVFFHGGAEWSHSPNAATRELYTGMVREGADLIIGTHPHIVQGFEWVGEKLVFWSLGNFVFAGMEDTGGGDEGLLIRLGYWGKKPLYIEPFALDLLGPRVELAPNQKQRLDNFYRMSKELAGK